MRIPLPSWPTNARRPCGSFRRKVTLGRPGRADPHARRSALGGFARPPCWWTWVVAFRHETQGLDPVEGGSDVWSLRWRSERSSPVGARRVSRAPRPSPHRSPVRATRPRWRTTVLPSVVTISASNGTVTATGSGEVIRDTGEIMTNNHVIAAGRERRTDQRAVQRRHRPRRPPSPAAIRRPTSP